MLRVLDVSDDEPTTDRRRSVEFNVTRVSPCAGRSRSGTPPSRRRSPRAPPETCRGAS